MTDRPIALVTGAARGIGLACARTLAREGFRVALSDIDADALRTASASIEQSLALPCDMAQPTQIESLFEQIEAEAGPVTALVNNAGIALPGDFLSYPLDDFRRVLDINLTAPFIATQRAARAMVEAGLGGAIVNMSSINAELAIPAIPAYCASKGGLRQLTRAAALALAPHGIRVNAVGPGSIDTAMMAGVNADSQAMRTALSRTPLGRLGTAAEIAEAVAFLASDKASYITGETIYVDGGRLGQNYPV